MTFAILVTWAVLWTLIFFEGFTASLHYSGHYFALLDLHEKLFFTVASAVLGVVAALLSHTAVLWVVSKFF